MFSLSFGFSCLYYLLCSDPVWLFGFASLNPCPTLTSDFVIFSVLSSFHVFQLQHQEHTQIQIFSLHSSVHTDVTVSLYKHSQLFAFPHSISQGTELFSEMWLIFP